MLDEIERALLRTPIPRGVALTMRKDDIARPLISRTDEGFCQASIYVVRKNGLPLWWPRSARRHRPLKFLASFIVQQSELTNYMRIRDAAKNLLAFAEKKMKARKWGLKAARTKRRTGVGFFRGPGRPRGILRSMEKKGSNPERLCVRCDVRHTGWTRCPQGESS